MKEQFLSFGSSQAMKAEFYSYDPETRQHASECKIPNHQDFRSMKEDGGKILIIYEILFTVIKVYLVCELFETDLYK